MKKIIAIILAALMLFSLVACGKNDTNDTNDTTNDKNDVNNNEGTVISDKELAANASLKEIAEAVMNKYANYIDHKGQYDIMVADAAASFEKYNQYANLTAEEFDEFLVEMENNQDLKDEFSYYASLGYEEFVSQVKEMANVYNQQANMTYEQYFNDTMVINEVDVNSEYLAGVTEPVSGYSEAYLYQPGMMGQAFIGYIFRVEEGTDIEEFKKFLLDNSDTRWNICTVADTTVCESFGDLVYFSMMAGFTAEQQDGLYNTFLETIKGSSK